MTYRGVTGPGITVLLLVLFVPTGLLAQLPRPPASPTQTDLFRLELDKPAFKSGDYSFPTSALFVTVRQSVEGMVSVQLQVPLGYVGRDSGLKTDWELRPGNPYLGLAWTSSEHPAELGFGLRAPILPNDADVRIMRIADFHRYEAFEPDLWSFSVHSVVGGDTDTFQGRADVILWVPLHGDVEVLNNYSLTARYQIVNLLAGLQVRGRAGLTGDRLVFGERTRHEVAATFEFLTTSFRPGIVIGKPIQGREVVDWVFGLTATFE